MTSPDATTNTIFFDFLCPYAWRGVELAAALRGQGEPFRLRHFSLVEGNHADNTASSAELKWRITDQALDAEGGAGYMQYQRGTLNAFLVAHAAARQGEDAAWNFTLALFRLHHEQKQPLDEPAFAGAAQVAGLDLARLETDRRDEAGLRQSLRADLDAAREVGVFGTPTIVLPDGSAAYYRFENLTRDPDKAQQWWRLYQTVLNSDAGIGTIKRARNRPPHKASSSKG